MVGVLRVANGFLHCALTALASHATQNRHITERHNDAAVSASNAPTCDARTINHITHSLPQLCLTRAWTSGPANYNDSIASVTLAPDEQLQSRNSETPDSNTMLSDATTTKPAETQPLTPTESEGGSGTQVRAESGAETLVYSGTEVKTNPDNAVDTEGSSFMSFEEWKEMMLRQTGQDPEDLRSRRAVGHQGDRRTPPQIGDFGLGEEDEISLDFENYLNQAGRDFHENEKAPRESVHNSEAGDTALYESDKTPLHRSKDAGKTCKERFSYSSFDAGATILKTGRGTKNAKAILIENKDSYMLLECGADSKYVIVELSDDILIDTVVLANFEFFSSMIRQFRVSVSDRYPVKMERWKEIGTFEARNSRDIQAFLVENPQIWAKYVRIEFQTHYGKEFYCPVSLLRIHGSRMLDSWKDLDGGREEELSIDEDESEIPDESSQIPSIGLHSPASEENTPVVGLEYTPWTLSPLLITFGTCPEPVASREGSVTAMNESKRGHPSSPRDYDHSTTGQDSNRAGKAPEAAKSSSQGTRRTPEATVSVPPATPPQDSTSQHTGMAKASESSSNTPTTASNNSFVTGNSSTPNRGTASSSPSQKPRASGTAGAPAASPTVQEGFFNAITKRLHHAEANLTLTMQYLEDHSRYVQESLQQAEQKQLSKVTAFLENLNQTVLAELRGMRDQYDQIWQSTVIALETQKEQADRDIVALSSRLNLLADEVVFQKRMAIVQAMLLLCCLFLVIFSRGMPIPYLAPLLDHGGASTAGAAPSHSNLSPRPSFASRFNQGNTDYHVEKYSDRNIESTSFSDGDAHRSSPTSRLTRLSPPLTPRFETSDMAGVEPPNSDCELDEPHPRRSTGYSTHMSQARKPLPALPEHPSPERPSSS